MIVSRLFRSVCEAVLHAHLEGTAHRDLKPSNILVARDGSPRMVDFGIARPMKDSGRTVPLQPWLTSHIPDMDAQEKALLPKQTLHLTLGGAGISWMRADYQTGLRLLLVAAFCLLLLTCANLANLLLARGLRKRRQTAVHVALVLRDCGWCEGLSLRACYSR